ncbi:VOC family protein [Bdellovibrio bacteriovorus]|uniref:Putative glyoxalase n=1 Tax=Bdellovibrio bacteriovorus str. Tiberius TaxID=1069642 RepID=K7YTX2_BDEBC|nr:VOC family protein [Bdellovibrio bacteriovorus]AFY01083.1 putative glyoxalase [Bdellovibrio bacteriovorus str. Tiberius]
MHICGWFEIPVKDMGRAMKFYEQSFDVSFTLSEMGPVKMAMFPMKEKEPGATGALVQGADYKPSHDGCLLYFSVNSIEDCLKKIKDKGGKTLTDKKSIGQYGFIATFEDTEGNKVALHAKN